MTLSTKRRRVLQALGSTVTIGAIGLAGCLDDAIGAQTADVDIEDDRFNPCNVNIVEEGVVTWENVGEEPHTVTAASTNWTLDVELQPEELTTMEFATEGVYLAVCSHHGDADAFEGMRMAIAVGSAEIEDELESEIQC